MSNTFYRSAKPQLVKRAEGDDGPTRLSIVAATGNPVRVWGADEVLRMDEGAVDLARLRNDAPFLIDHVNKMDSIIGRVDRAAVVDGQLEVEVELDTSERAREYAGKVERGMAGKVSIGFDIEDYRLIRGATDDEVALYEVTRWSPFEVSAVAVPADDGAAVKAFRRRVLSEKEAAMPVETEARADASEARPEPVPQVVREDVQAEERKRFAELVDFGQNYAADGGVELAHEVAAQGGTLLDLKERVFEKKDAAFRERAKANQASGHPTGAKGDGDPGFAQRDYERFSIGRAAYGILQRKQGKQFNCHELEMMAAENERQTSDNVRATSAGSFSVSTRLLNEARRARTLQATGGVGANLVETELKPELIEFLRPATVFLPRVRMLADQKGIVEFPRQTGSASANWRAESAAASAPSDQALDKVKADPKEIILSTKRTRLALKQSNIDLDMFIMDDLRDTGAEAFDFGISIGGVTNGPVGIVSQLAAGNAAYSTETDVAGKLSYDDLIDAKNEVRKRKAFRGDLVFFGSSDVYADLEKTLIGGAASYKFILEDGRAAGHEVLFSNLIENKFNYAANKVVYGGSGARKAIGFGNLQDVVLVQWYGWDMLVNEYTGQNDNTVTISLHGSADVILRHPQSFHIKVYKA